MFVSDKKLSDINFERVKKSIDIHKKNLIISVNKMCLTVHW